MWRWLIICCCCSAIVYGYDKHDENALLYAAKLEVLYEAHLTGYKQYRTDAYAFKYTPLYKKTHRSVRTTTTLLHGSLLGKYSKDPHPFTDQQLIIIERAIAFVNFYVRTQYAPILFTYMNHLSPPSTDRLGDAHLWNKTIAIYTPNIQSDLSLFIVMIHELLHLLGFGSELWYYYQAHINSTTNLFQGPNYIQQYLPRNTTGPHWSIYNQQVLTTTHDIMLPYLYEDTIVGYDTFIVPQDTNYSVISFACRSSQDCPSKDYICFIYSAVYPGKCMKVPLVDYPGVMDKESIKYYIYAMGFVLYIIRIINHPQSYAYTVLNNHAEVYDLFE